MCLASPPGGRCRALPPSFPCLCSLPTAGISHSRSPHMWQGRVRKQLDTEQEPAPHPRRHPRRCQGTAAHGGRPMAPKPELTFLAWIHVHTPNTHVAFSRGEWSIRCTLGGHMPHTPPHQQPPTPPTSLLPPISCTHTHHTCGNQQGWGGMGQQDISKSYDSSGAG